MKISKVNYRPDLTIAENARLNNCSESNIRYYIRSNNIDRKSDRTAKTILKLRKLYRDGMKPSEMASLSALSLNTVKKYWEAVVTEDELSKVDSHKRQKLTIRQRKEYYATHPSVTSDLLKVETFSENILEPCCGGGFMAEVIKKAGYKVRATDIVDRGYGEGGIDFLTSDFQIGTYDIITNPPYNICVDFINKALKIAKNKVAILLPLRYLTSAERYELLYKSNPPVRVYVYIERICIAKNGEFEKYERGTNPLMYAWFVWEKGYKGETTLKWIHNDRNSHKQYKVVIFDFDGTLLDTQPLLQYEHLFKQVKRGTNEWERGRREYLSHVKDCKQWDGMNEVINYLRYQKMKVAVVTANTKDRVVEAIKAFGWEDVINAKDIIGCFSIDRFRRVSKDNGDPCLFLKALEVLNVKADECIAFGNELSDYQAAKSIGIEAYNCLWGASEEEQKTMLHDMADNTISEPLQIINKV